MENVNQSEEIGWGVRHNHSTLYSRKIMNIPEGCSHWARPIDIDYWESKGVVIWNHCSIIQHFKSGKISRARYGYQEVETGYSVFLGGCNAPEEQPWGKITTRAGYLVEKALRESFFYSLDVDDFRDYLGITPEIMDDESVIRQPHEARAESKCIPFEVRNESQLWLLEHSQTYPRSNIGKRS